MLMLMAKLTNHELREFVSQAGKVGSINPFGKTEVKDFLSRQIRLIVINLSEYNDFDFSQSQTEAHSNEVAKLVKSVLNYTDIQAFTTQFSDSEWTSLAKIFLKVVELLICKGDHRESQLN